MALETTRFEVTDYIRTAEALEEYLRAAFETDDPAFIADALGVVARSRGMTELARDTGISRQTLYKALSADGKPGFAVILAVAHALGFKLVPERVLA